MCRVGTRCQGNLDRVTRDATGAHRLVENGAVICADQQAEWQALAGLARHLLNCATGHADAGMAMSKAFGEECMIQCVLDLAGVNF
jgi:hypothetical protein